MGDLYDGEQWTEKHIEDTEHWIANGTSSAWHWTGREMDRAGSAVAQGGVEALGWADSRVAPMVLGHYYDTKIPLGVFHQVTPAALLDAIRHNPKHFPIPGDKNFDLGAIVTLSFFGTRNPVIVKKIDTSEPDRASMLLQTQTGHFFGGTAEHIVLKQSGDRLVYEVIGHGPAMERWDRNRINVFFGKDLWKPLVLQRVLPLAKRLENQQ